MWDAVEADFQRDYGINLMEQIDFMSWRRFTVLFRNLSPYGAVASRADELREREEKEAGAANTPAEEAQAMAFFSRMLSTKG